MPAGNPACSTSTSWRLVPCCSLTRRATGPGTDARPIMFDRLRGSTPIPTRPSYRRVIDRGKGRASLSGPAPDGGGPDRTPLIRRKRLPARAQAAGRRLSGALVDHLELEAVSLPSPSWRRRRWKVRSIQVTIARRSPSRVSQRFDSDRSLHLLAQPVSDHDAPRSTARTPYTTSRDSTRGAARWRGGVRRASPLGRHRRSWSPALGHFRCGWRCTSRYRSCPRA